MKFKLLAASLVLHVFVTAQNLNVTLRSHFRYPTYRLSNICGYVDKTGNEYALVGTSKGMSIVDITNPDHPAEIMFVPGPDNLWREIKVKDDYAYVATEGGGGLQIVYLGTLPNKSGITFKNWTGMGLGTIHTLHIDGNFVYMYGTNIAQRAGVIADITDRYNPVYAGTYENKQSLYVHDGFVRNDTLYACHTFGGFCTLVDCRDKKNLKIFGSVETPGKFTHNCWLSANSKTLFTTDEVANSFLTSYNISDPANITELDRIQSNPGSLSVVHNTHVLKAHEAEYAVTSWYRDGFTIVDVTRPSNLVQVGNYDTCPDEGKGFNGAWGVYPFFPSGTIIVSDVEQGLFVCTPVYKRACYLEGTVTDSITGMPVYNATIEIVGTSVKKLSKITGEYATGIVSPGGRVDVMYSAKGYYTKLLKGIELKQGVVTLEQVQLTKSPAGISENALEQSKIQIYPNPFTTELTLSYEFGDRQSFQKGSRIQVSDLVGRSRYETEIDQPAGKLTIHPQLDAGIYFVRIINGTKSSAPVKIIKTN